jgi:hypothetical protein
LDRVGVAQIGVDDVAAVVAATTGPGGGEHGERQSGQSHRLTQPLDRRDASVGVTEDEPYEALARREPRGAGAASEAESRLPEHGADGGCANFPPRS